VSEAEDVIDRLNDEVEEAMEIALRLMCAVCIHVPEGERREEKRGREEKRREKGDEKR
jgi:hypothetical protein